MYTQIQIFISFFYLKKEEHDKNSKSHVAKADLEFKLLVKPAFTEPNGIINGILKNVDTLQAKNNVSPLIVKDKHLSSEQIRNSPYKSTLFKQENHQQKQQQQSPAKCNTKDDIIKKNISKHSMIVVALLFLFGYLCVMSVWKNFGPTSSNINLQNDLSSSCNDALSLAKQKAYQTKFNEHMKFIKSKYPNQTSLFWANIESTYRHSIVKMKDPSIVLMVSDKLTSQTGHELSSDILNAIKTSIEDKQSSNLNNLIINPVDYSDLVESKQFDQVKLIIDNKLNKIFLNGQRVALVRSIQQIPATSMLLFYTYGDDLLSAKYPGVVILMTLEIEDTIAVEKREQLTKNSKKIMEFVETHMFQMWSKFVGEDQLKPLFTRIGNNVVFVNNESK